MTATRTVCSGRVHHWEMMIENPGKVSDSKKPSKKRQMAKPAKFWILAEAIDRMPQTTTLQATTFPVWKRCIS